MTTRSAIINVMAAAAHKAARRLIRDFGEVEHLQVSRKGPADFVSQADRRAERVLREELSKARPSFGLLMEETGAVEGRDSAHRWLVDPLDGTTNFLHGIPHWAISIALQREDDIYAGVIYDPLRDEMFWAERGLGAYVNDTRIRVSSRGALADAVVATGLPFGERPGRAETMAVLPTVMDATAGIRRFGSAALDLAFVAAGRYEAFWEYGLEPWDVGAGIVLVREAGGLVSDLSGGTDMIYGKSIVTANGALFDPFTRLLRGAISAQGLAPATKRRGPSSSAEKTAAASNSPRKSEG
ncbi:MAG: inositol monophosphatase family protein [Alphaproteobacteria bacterium]